MRLTDVLLGKSTKQLDCLLRISFDRGLGRRSGGSFREAACCPSLTLMLRGERSRSNDGARDDD